MIELKEIAPYLAHELKSRLSQKGKFNLDSEYPNENANKIGVISAWFIGKEIGGVLEINDKYSFDFCEIDEIEILFHPLSDLTKPCLEGGKVPIVELARIIYSDLLWADFDFELIENKVEFWGYESRWCFWYNQKSGSFHTIVNDESGLTVGQLQLFNWLYEHHFWLGDQSRFGVDIIDINEMRDMKISEVEKIIEKNI